MIDQGYVSTSVYLDSALVFAERKTISVFRIGVGADTRAIFMESAIGDGWEKELVLKSGTRFRVKSKRVIPGEQYLKERKDDLRRITISETHQLKEQTIIEYVVEVEP